MSVALTPSRVAAHAPVTSRLTPARLQALPAAYVHPGQLVVSADVGVLTTILGSCVAVCLHDAKLRVGGLNHFLLPNKCGPGDVAGRYAPSAIEALIEQLLSCGALQTRLVAKVVGGASVLAAFGESKEHLGLKNVAAALETLASYGIPVIGTDTGGTRGRKLVFSPRDGATLVQQLGGGA